MNIFVDEGVDFAVVARLRQDTHDVTYVAELSPSISDDEVLQQANTRSALFLTADKDFGDMVFRQRRIHAGVVLIRLSGISNVAKAEQVAEVFRSRGPELMGAFCVIAPGTVRIRHATGP